MEKSWFSTNLKVVQNPSKPQIFSPSFMSSHAVSTDSENMGRKSKKMRLFLNPEQRRLVRQWFGVSRYVFNKTIKILQEGIVKANWKAIKTDLLNDLPEQGKRKKIYGFDMLEFKGMEVSKTKRIYLVSMLARLAF
ncbi:helix-turn-helix domain-containing protein [Moorena sp. SIO1G6]|uniref:helix-turn-helix domain-containing protein n=1 Tax=Moorena sp. SIO1G6 TaxID=2607840 RepID=UPI00338DAB55